jgi:hypothetical protein
MFQNNIPLISPVTSVIVVVDYRSEKYVIHSRGYGCPSIRQGIRLEKTVNSI